VESQQKAPEVSKGWRSLAACTLLLSVCAVWGVDYLPTNDGPRHVFAVHAAARLEVVEAGYGQFFEAAHPITSRGFAAIFGPLDRVLPWREALRLSLALMVVLWGLGALWFAHAVHPGRAWLGVAIAAGALQWSLYMGFFSFYVATASGLFVAALAFRRPAWSRGERGLLAALLLVQALFHVVAAAATGLLIACLALARAAPGGRLRAAVGVALLGGPAAAVVVALLTLDLGGPAVDDRTAQSGGVWAPFWALGRCFVSGPPWRAWPLTLLALAAPLAWRKLARGALRAEDRALLLAGGLLLAVALALPLHLPFWEYASVRFLPLGVCALVLAIPLERLRWPLLRRGLLVGIGVFALLSPAWAWQHHRGLRRDGAEALSGLDADLQRRGPRLPVLLGDTRPGAAGAAAAVPYAAPLANLGHLYAVAQGGVVPYNFAVDPRIHHIVYSEGFRRYPAVPPGLDAWRAGAPTAGPERAAVVTRAAGYGSVYEDVILWGRPEDAELFLHRGYVVDWRSGGLMLAHFEGCPLRLSLPEEPAPGADAFVEMGWHPLRETARRVSLARARRDGSGRRVLDLPRAPCGAVWLRLLAEGRSCAGADSRGRWVVASTRDTPRVHCEWREEASEAPLAGRAAPVRLGAARLAGPAGAAAGAHRGR
jgi:hypothetical protein